MIDIVSLISAKAPQTLSVLRIEEEESKVMQLSSAIKKNRISRIDSAKKHHIKAICTAKRVIHVYSLARPGSVTQAQNSCKTVYIDIADIVYNLTYDDNIAL